MSGCNDINDFFRFVGTEFRVCLSIVNSWLPCWLRLIDFSVRLHASVMVVSPCVSTSVSISWFYFRKPPVNDIKKHGTEPTEELRLHYSMYASGCLILGKWGLESWSSVSISSFEVYCKYWLRLWKIYYFYYSVYTTKYLKSFYYYYYYYI